MCLGIDLLGRKDVGDGARFVGHEGGAKCAHVLASAHGFFAPCAKDFVKAEVGVGNQREGKVVLRNKLLMRCCRVATYADDRVAELCEFVVVIAQTTRLRRATRCVVFGVEIND